jgi:hypothetical protein
MGRPPIGTVAMTDAERQRRRRERVAQGRPALTAAEIAIAEHRAEMKARREAKRQVAEITIKRCSFCSKARPDVRMFWGHDPAPLICDECLPQAIEAIEATGVTVAKPAAPAADDRELRAEIERLLAENTALKADRKSVVAMIEDGSIAESLTKWREGHSRAERLRKAYDVAAPLAGGGLACFARMEGQYMADKMEAGEVLDFATLKPIKKRKAKRGQRNIGKNGEKRA